MVIGGRPVSDPGDEDFKPIRKKSADENNRGGGDRGGGDRGRKDNR